MQSHSLSNHPNHQTYLALALLLSKPKMSKLGFSLSPTDERILTPPTLPTLLGLGLCVCAMVRWLDERGGQEASMFAPHRSIEIQAFPDDDDASLEYGKRPALASARTHWRGHARGSSTNRRAECCGGGRKQGVR